MEDELKAWGDKRLANLRSCAFVQTTRGNKRAHIKAFDVFLAETNKSWDEAGYQELIDYVFILATQGV